VSAAVRRCGECTACCRLTPVAELGKPAGERCKHQRHNKGCVVYAARPPSCKAWSCLWLSDPATEALTRPDRSGYVLDCMTDFTRARNELTGAETVFEVVQIWANSRGVTLEAGVIPYLEGRHVGAVIRSDEPGAVVLVPPWVSPTSVWGKAQGNVCEPQHTAEEVERALGRRPSASA
jgi:hypothetical protein